MKRSSKIIWKRLNKSEPRWLSDSMRSRLKERKKDNRLCSKPSIENSKWKLMILEKRRLNSWWLVVISREKSS